MFGFNRNTYTELPTHRHHSGPNHYHAGPNHHHHVVHHQNVRRGGFSFGFSPFSVFTLRPRNPGYTPLRARSVNSLNDKIFGAILIITGIALTNLGFAALNPPASITGISMTAIGIAFMLA